MSGGSVLFNQNVLYILVSTNLEFKLFQLEGSSCFPSDSTVLKLSRLVAHCVKAWSEYNKQTQNMNSVFSRCRSSVSTSGLLFMQHKQRAVSVAWV